MIAPSAWLLDLTRLVSRLGRGPLTGIDRVELAYLHNLIGRPEPLFAVVRTAVGFVLLDKDGAGAILDRVVGQVPLGQPDLLGLLTRRHLPQHLRAEADMRRLAFARCLPMRLGAMLRRAMPEGTVYLNVGHSNISARMMRAVKSVPGAQVIVMVHDTIPMDYPEFCRIGVPKVFAEKLALVSAYANIVVHTAACTKAQTEAHFLKVGRVPLGIVARLGVVVAPHNLACLGVENKPYYMALGTIEPRKNVGLLVQIWRALQSGAGPVPHLYIVGNRGWANPALFDDLDKLVAEGSVTVLHNLADDAVMLLLQGAEALLFPSFAEGYGIPPIEAAALGVPVFAGKLPVVVEMLDNYPVYLDSSDVYAWVDAINHQLNDRQQGRDADRQIRVPPSWADHFDILFSKPGRRAGE